MKTNPNGLKDADDIKRALSTALFDSKTIQITIKGDSGRVSICVGHNIIATYQDAYDAMRDLVPDFYAEFIDG